MYTVGLEKWCGTLTSQVYLKSVARGAVGQKPEIVCYAESALWD